MGIYVARLYRGIRWRSFNIDCCSDHESDVEAPKFCHGESKYLSIYPHK